MLVETGPNSKAIFLESNQANPETDEVFVDNISDVGEHYLEILNEINPNEMPLNQIPLESWKNIREQLRKYILQESQDPEKKELAEIYGMLVQVMHDQPELDQLKQLYEKNILPPEKNDRFRQLKLAAADWQTHIMAMMAKRREKSPDTLEVFWDYYNALTPNSQDSSTAKLYRTGITTTLAAAELVQSFGLGQVMFSSPEDDVDLGIDLLVKQPDNRFALLQVKGTLSGKESKSLPQFIKVVKPGTQDTSMSRDEQNLVAGMGRWEKKYQAKNYEVSRGLIVYIPQKIKNSQLVDPIIGRAIPEFVDLIRAQASQLKK